MSQRFEYYLIRPRECLLETIRRLNPEWIDLFSEPVLWARREGVGDVFQVPIRDALLFRKTQVKILFLANLLREYGRDEGLESDLCTFLATSLEVRKLEASIFDRWWILEHIDGIDQRVEEVEMRLTESMIDTLQIQENPIISLWLSSLQVRTSLKNQ